MIRQLRCPGCKLRRRHLVVFISQQVKFEEERLKGECVVYRKQCIACNKTTKVEVPLLEWKHLEKED